jgi:hypothetical protein
MSRTQTGVPLVGRERELAELMAALADAVEGHGSAVFIGGEPGIGKTRLADELAARAAQAGQRVLWGRGWEDAGAPPYWPWVQVLRALVRAVSADALPRFAGAGISDITQLLPELRDRYPDLPPPAEYRSDAARFQLFDSTAALLRNACEERPLLLVIDDLQAADTPSILLLQFVVSQVSDMSVLILCTYRDIEVTPDHPLTPALADMSRERSTRLMALRGLAIDAVGDYIDRAADTKPTDALVAAVWRETKGNPLFLGEAVRLLESEGRLEDVGDLDTLRVTIPEGVRAVIGRRLRQLDSGTVAMLEVAASVGPEFGVELVRHVLDLSPPLAAGAVDEASRAGLLLPISGSAVRYRISHDLVRETLYDGLSPSRRAELHRRIAQTIESIYARSLDEHVAELAFHFAQAATGSIDDDGTAEQLRSKATGYGLRAGDQAYRAIAYEEAARLYALSLSVQQQKEHADPEMHIEILLRLGDAQSRSGDLDNVRKNFAEAADLARAFGSKTLFARAAVGYGGRHQWTRPGHDTRIVPLLQGALDWLDQDDPHLRIRLLTRLAGAWRQSPERRNDAAALSSEAIELAHELHDPMSLSFALAGRFWATFWPDNPDDRRALSEEIIELADVIADPERLGEARLLRFVSLSERGRMTDARRELETLADLVARTRQPAQLWLDDVNRCWLALLEGQFPLAEELLKKEFASTYHVTPALDDLSSARMHQFLLRRELGQLSDQEADTRSAARDFPWYPLHRAALACLLVETDHRAEAQRILDELAIDRFAGMSRDNEWLLGICLTSDAAAMLGDTLAASVLYEQLLPYAGRHAIGHSEGSVGVVDRYLGLLAETLGQLDDAERHLGDAIELLQAMGARPWAAHAQHELATVLRTRGGVRDAARANVLDSDALQMAARLGMALAEEIRAGQNAPPASAAPTASATPTASSATIALGVLRREGDVWAIEFGMDAFRLRDAKGLRYLELLLGTPGAERHSLDLAQSIDADVARVAYHVGSSEPDAVASDAFGGIGPSLDPEARQAYRARLEDVREELAEATAWNDTERARRLQEEQDALVHELASAMGLGGQARTAASPAERARISVTRAIRGAMERIGDASPTLGAHLAATIRTGTFCVYLPDPRAPITWVVTDGRAVMQTARSADPAD